MRSKPTNRRRSSPLRLLRWGLRLVLLFAVIDIFYISMIWPDWDRVAKTLPKSQFIQAYEAARKQDRTLPRLQWRPVSIKEISPHLGRMVILSEDGRFYHHHGIDVDAISEAFQYNIDRGRIVYGASTISQQTVKNLFLSASRDPLRKWHELVLTLGMEFNLSKRKILELYLNVAEFGPGIYGAEAAARAYWGISAAELSQDQAIELAATLPSPKLNNPRTQTPAFLHRVDRINTYIIEQLD